MKTRTIFSLLILAITLSAVTGQRTTIRSQNAGDFDYITALKDTLNRLANDTDNEYFRLHCQSMIAVIESKDTYTAGDSAFLKIPTMHLTMEAIPAIERLYYLPESAALHDPVMGITDRWEGFVLMAETT